MTAKRRISCSKLRFCKSFAAGAFCTALRNKLRPNQVLASPGDDSLFIRSTSLHQAEDFEVFSVGHRVLPASFCAEARDSGANH